MPVVPRRLTAWHQAVWTTPAPLAAGACRVVLAVVFLLFLTVNLPADYRTWADRPDDLYRPVGVLNLYGSDGPPVPVLVAAHWVAKVGVGFLLVGLFTRLSLVAVTVAMLHCCSAEPSFRLGISHEYNPVLLAALGLWPGARSPLSVDYLLAGRGRPAYWTTPRVGVALVLFAVGWSFANAALHKVYLGNHQPFAWCYSDNMRNIILFQHLKWQKPVPDALAWVLARPWAYKAMAWGNVACQFLPVFGAVLVRSPRIRLVLAGLLAAELLGLGFVMGMWGGYGDIWLLLTLLFVDWDALATRRGPGVAGPDRWWWARRAWAVGLAGAFVVLSCWPRQVRAAYPLMSFNMFSYLLVDKPYGEHRPHPMVLNEWEVDADPPLRPEQAVDVWTKFHAGRAGPAEAADRVRQYCEWKYKVRVDAVRGTKRCFVLPAPPDPAVGRGPGGAWVSWSRTADGPARTLGAGRPVVTPTPDGGRRCRLALAPNGLDVAGARFEYATLGTEGTTPVAATDLGTGEYELAFPPGVRGFVFVTARVKDATYYVCHLEMRD